MIGHPFYMIKAPMRCRRLYYIYVYTLFVQYDLLDYRGLMAVWDEGE